MTTRAKNNSVIPPAQFDFPSVENKKDADYCAVCGGSRIDDGEIATPCGLISIDIDGDLCLECAIHLWRALKEAYPDDFRRLAITLLGQYSVTREAVGKVTSTEGATQ